MIAGALAEQLQISAPRAGALPAMAHNYVVTAQPPTAVLHCLVGNFTGPEDINLIVAYSTRIEVSRLTPEGLQPVFEAGIYGRVATMKLLRLEGETTDSLFLTTERYFFCLLGWDAAAKQFQTKSNGDLHDRIGRAREDGQIALVDPGGRIVGLHLYDGLFKVIPLLPGRGLGEAFNIRMEEIRTIDLAMLHCTAEPTLVVLYEDLQNQCHLKTYVVRDKDLRPGPWPQVQFVHPQSSHVIPVPAPAGGVVLVAEDSVTYFRNGDEDPNSRISQAIDLCEIKTWAYVDPDGRRILLGDQAGQLYMLVLQLSADTVEGLSWEPLGQGSIPSSLAYLDSGVVYVGSAQGDSQLIALSAEPEADSGNFFEVRENYTNLGPIVDFCVVDLDRQGQCQLVTCSGVGKDGSLRLVRNGIGINESASIELPGVQGLWSLRESSSAAFDKFLVQSFVSETRMLMVSPPQDVTMREAGEGSQEEDEEEGGDLEEGEIAGFDSESRTLLASNMASDTLLQVTPTEARLVSCGTLQCLSVWSAAAGTEIVIASCSPSQVVLATEGCGLVYLEVQEREGAMALVQAGQLTLEHEIACLCLAPADGSAAGGQASDWLAVGLWTEISLRLLRLPSLETAQTELLGGDVIPRSVLISVFEGAPMLLCGLGDGQLLTFSLDTESAALSDRKKISLGTQPIVLSAFSTAQGSACFAACDRPTVVYSLNGKPAYSNVNRKDINYACPFHCEGFPDHLAISTSEELTIGTVDEIQKLHIRKVPLMEQPRRICHQPQSRTFAVVTMMANDLSESGPDGDQYEETHYLRVFDDQTFEVVDSVELKRYESALCIVSTGFRTDEQDESETPYLVLGTAFALPGEEEPSSGRILVYQITEHKKLALVTELPVRGAVYTMQPFHGKLVAGVDSKIYLYSWSGVDAAGKGRLSVDCDHHGHIIALHTAVRGDFIVVGDLMKSVSLLVYKPPTAEQSEPRLEEVAKVIPQL